MKALKSEKTELLRKPQQQSRPGEEKNMDPQPISDTDKKGSDKLKNKIAVITGGDSGIGKSVALLFAKEGADIAVVYLTDYTDAKDTQNLIKRKYDRECLLLSGDISKEDFCRDAIEKVVSKFGRIDVLVNNAGVHYECKKIEDLSSQNLIKTFETNIYSMFWLTKYALPHMKSGSSIINTSSVTAYRGSAHLLDYSATKGAIVSFTRSLSANLLDRGIRVNGVAPGPLWTPLIPSSFSAQHTAKHGANAPMKRAGEPAEVAPCYLFLACDDSSYMTGQFLHPNGGEIING